MMDIEDKKIKEFFAKDTIIPNDADSVFENTLRKIKSEQTNKQKSGITFVFKKWLAVAACVLITFAGVNSYARANGYNNIFFMIKEIAKEKQISKEEAFYDRDIIISYKSFYIAQDIEMQVNELQITGEKAKLFLYVKENGNNDITPFKYKVYNQDGTKTCEVTSNKKEETKYAEILELKNYVENQSKLTLQVFSSEDKLLKTIIIDLEEKTIEARTENIEVKKISQIKLNNFLTGELKKLESEDENKKIIILKLTDISYINSSYIVKYLYTEVTDEQINNDIVEESEIKEGEAQFNVVNDEFKLIDIMK